jgi:predicted membrane protein (TIGR00267 family)
LLDQIVERITADEDVWVGVMMSEEHQLTPSDRKDALKSAIVVGIAAIVGSLIPLIPFLFLEVRTSIWVSLLSSALTLFVMGVYKARTTVGHAGKSGFEMTAIGTLSALMGYLVGLVLKLHPTP